MISNPKGIAPSHAFRPEQVIALRRDEIEHLHDRPDLQWIASAINPQSRVLDLGCGDGRLLAHLRDHKQCSGYGVEIDDNNVLACIRNGVNAIQQDIEAGLSMFGHGLFDVVVLSLAIQATHNTEQVLREMSQVGREGIISFPNFGHWYHIWSIAKGRMPVSKDMPYAWYNTPNLHLATTSDFEDFLQDLGMEILDRAFFTNGRQIHYWPNLRSTLAVYRFRRRAP